MAIPLSQVARLEEFPRTKLERLGTQQVVQYRGGILSLVDVSRTIDGLQSDQPQSGDSIDCAAETVPVIVCPQNTGQVGLVVDKILDIVPDPASTRSQASRPGVLFTAVVQDRVTEIIDVPALLASSKLS